MQLFLKMYKCLVFEKLFPDFLGIYPLQCRLKKYYLNIIFEKAKMKIYDMKMKMKI